MRSGRKGVPVREQYAQRLQAASEPNCYVWGEVGRGWGTETGQRWSVGVMRLQRSLEARFPFSESLMNTNIVVSHRKAVE